MLRLSLKARLTGTFVVITVVCFTVVGVLLMNAVYRRIYQQDEINLVLSARHLRRFVGELDSTDDLVAHQARLTWSVLGDTENALRITDKDGKVLVDHDLSHFTVQAQAVAPADQRLTVTDIRSWNDGDGEIRGVSTLAALKDGSMVTVTVARSMADRSVLLLRYRWDTVIALLLGTLAATVLSYLLIHRALRPLRAMTASASSVTAHRLSTRLSAENTPAELHALAHALNDMLTRLEEGFDRLWQFTVDLAHDLRTPVAILRGSNEVALSRPRSVAEYQSLLGSNIEECDRVSQRIESMLFIARAENPQFALQRLVIDTNEELHLLADYYEGIASDAGVVVRIDAHATVYADRDLFRRAVSNLLSNALRYTPSGATLSLIATTTETGVSVSVENPGPGIAPDHLEKVFDRFYRVDRSRTDSNMSTGLGLSIVKSIMDLHGGDVLATSELEGLTRFTLRFPRVTIPD
ncbi:MULTISPECIES: heavy metal sensor histidine kinase [Luteibacter]|uniref:heavy metal sensor histidine kinase n=1 Tax=Luteibacter sp. dw_328 TaxID=2719796 RepID=UPI0007BF832F|nr:MULTISPECIES: heavy metal sensor histidine kinase [Luteibacter]